MSIELVDKKIDNTSYMGYYFVAIDGTKAKTIDCFLNEIADAFKFPEYFGFNYNSLQECLNDLNWIDEDNYALHIKNYDNLLSEEDTQEIIDLLGILKEVAEEWANVPNYEGEEEFRDKADFTILIEKTDKSLKDLEVVCL